MAGADMEKVFAETSNRKIYVCDLISNVESCWKEVDLTEKLLSPFSSEISSFEILKPPGEIIDGLIITTVVQTLALKRTTHF